jgi:predicted enzyme related to lactoylglutathione lyase
MPMAINGMHGLLYTTEPGKLRAALRDVFGFAHVDAGDGWLIFRMPPAELGVHPLEDDPPHHELSFMCADIEAAVRDLRAKGVTVMSEPQDHGYGIVTMLSLPGGVEMQLYEPRHPIAADIQPASKGINGLHGLLYTSQPEQLRAMLRDVFGFPHVDAGDGWLIFRLPPSELGVHPSEGPTYESGVRQQITFMCDDIRATVRDLRAKGVAVKGEPRDEGWGVTVLLELPGGCIVMLYEPRHPVAAQIG